MTTTPFDHPRGLIDRLLFPSLRAAYERGRADEAADRGWPLREYPPPGEQKWQFFKDGRFVDAPEGWFD